MRVYNAYECVLRHGIRWGLLLLLLLQTVKAQDYVPPSIATYSPGLSSNGQSASTNIVLTFTENIQRGNGNIWLTPSGGTGSNNVLTIPISDSSQVTVTGNQAIINPTNDLVDHGGKTYTVTMLSGGFRDTSYNSFGGIYGTSYTFVVSDGSAPTVTTYSPTLGATSQDKATNVILTFNELIQAGSGNVVITPSGGNGADDEVTIAVGDATQISFSGTTVTINPSNDLIDLGAKVHTINMDPGVIKDAANNNFAGFTGISTITNLVITVVGGVYRVNNVAQTTVTMKKGSTYYFDQSDSSNTGHPIGLSSTSDGTHGSGSLWTNGVVYKADGTVSSGGYLGAFDTSTARGIEITSPDLTVLFYFCTNHASMGGSISQIESTLYAFQVTDSTPPTVASYAPALAATSQDKATDIVLTFDEFVQAGTGIITITPTGGNQADTTLNINVADASQISFSGTTATINPTNDFVDHGLKTLTITMAAGVMKDIENNGYAGLAGSTYVFTIADSTNPVVTTYSPEQDETAAGRADNIVVTFNENIQAGTGDIVITPSGGNGANTPVTIAVGDAQVTISTVTVTINPTNVLSDMGDKTQTITIASGVLKDAQDNPYAGLSGITYQYVVQDVSAPLAVGYSPAQAATGVSVSTDVILTFDEQVKAGSGYIYLSPTALPHNTASAGGGATISINDGSQITISGTTVAINPTSDFGLIGNKYRISIASGVILDMMDNEYAGISGTTYEFSTVDSVAPLVTSYSPGLGSTSQAKSTNIVITFDEHIQAGTGDIIVTPSGGNQADTALTVPVGDSQVTFSTTSATVDLTTDMVDHGLKTYTITMASGVMKDTYNNVYTGLSGSAYVFTVADSTAPIVTGYLPVPAAAAAAKGANIVLTFNENVQAGTGNIVITPSGGNGANVPVSIPVGDAQVSISTTTVTINPTADLADTGDKLQTVTMSSGVIKDSQNNAYAGLIGTAYLYTVADSTAPIIASYSPAQAATGVSKTGNIVITFNEHVQGGTGNIVITPSGGNQANIALTISVGDTSQVSFSGNDMTINPTNALADDGTKVWTTTIVSGVVKDLQNNDHTGLSGTTYQFTIDDVSPPEVAYLGYSPVDGSLAQASSTDIVITFKEDIQAGTGNIVITPTLGNQVNTVLNIPIGDGQVSFSATAVTINPSSDFSDHGGKLLTITMSSGVIKDIDNNLYAGIFGSDYSFSIADGTAPLVTVYNPLQGNAAVNKGDNIVLTFNENIKAGAGNIVITPSSGNGPDDAVTIAIGATVISNTQITINPPADLADLGGKTHTITMVSGVILDTVDNAYAGLSGTTYQFVVVDSTPPLLVSYSPVLGATTVDKADNIVLTFTEYIQANSGNILLTPAGGNQANTPLTIAVGDTSQVAFSAKTVTINPTSDLDDIGNKVWTITFGSGVIQDMGNLAFTGIGSTPAYQFTVIDSTPPAVTTFSPAVSATSQNKNTNIVLTFTENVQGGSGDITIVSTGGNGADTTINIDIDDSQIQVLYTVVTINPTLDLNDQGLKTHTVTMANTLLKDARNNAYAGLAGTAYTFTVADSTDPLLVSKSPVHNAVDQVKTTNIVLVFSEHVQAGTGNIVLTPTTGSAVTIDVTVGAPVINFATTTLTINPSADLDATGMTYTITAASGVIQDVQSQPYAGISSTNYQFSVADTTDAVVTAYSPLVVATGVSKSVNIVLTFDDDMQAGTGNIVMTPSGGSGSNTAFTIDVTDATQVSFSTNTVTINPTNDMDDRGAKTYTITIASGVFTDTDTNIYAGISGTNYEFTLVDASAPLITAYDPAQGSSTNTNLISSNVILTFDENVQAGIGNIVITPSGGNGANPVTYIAVGDGQVTISTNTVTINPNTDLPADGTKTMTVSMAAGVINDLAGNNLAQLSGVTYQFVIPDQAVPILQTYSPVQGATGIAKTANIVLTFNEYVQAGTGLITLTPSGGSGSNTATTVDVTDVFQVTFSGTSATINPTADLDDRTAKTYTITMPTGVLTDADGNSAVAITGTTYQYVLVDTTAPYIIGGGYSPAQSAIDQSNAVDIVLTFDETVQAGTGNIVLTPSGGNQANTIVNIDVTDATQVSISGSVLTIDKASNLDDRGGKIYTITFPSGVIVDSASNAFVGISGSTYLFGVADTTAPTVTSYAPTQASNSISKSADIVLTFDEFVRTGTGNIVVTPSGGSGSNTPVNIDVGDTQVTISGNTVSINPSAPFDDRTGKTQTVTIASGVIKDINNVAFPGITGSTYAFDVADSTPPVIATYTPVNGATGVALGVSIVIVFDESIKKGSSGSVILTPTGGNQANPSVNIPVPSSEISVSTNTMTISPTNILDDRGSKTYEVVIDAGVILDLGDFAFGGIVTGVYGFTVDDVTAPTVTAYLPVAGDPAEPKDTNIVITFIENIQSGTGYILITPAGGNQNNDVVTIPVVDSQVSIVTNTITINPTNNLDDRGSKTMHITMVSGVIKDIIGNSFAGLTGSTYTFVITDTSAPEIDNYNPAQYELGVAKASNIVLTFNENIAANTGLIVLTPSGGSGTMTNIQLDVTDSMQCIFINNILTINPTQNLDDRTDKSYTVTAATGVITDTTGNQFELAGDTYVFTTIDASVPLLETFSPVQGATTVLKENAIIFTFNENVMPGSGSVTFAPAGGNNINPAAIIPVSDAQISITGLVVTIYPTGYLDDELTKTYTVTMPLGAFTDMRGNQAGDISGTTYQFIVPDVTKPVIVNYSPAQSAINQDENTNIVITFSETVVKSVGSILLTPTGGGIAYTMNIDDANVALSGSTQSGGASGNPQIVVNFPTNLVPGKEYKVTFPSNLVKDISPTPNPILAMDDTVYKFQIKTKLIVKFVEHVTLSPTAGKNVIFASPGGITHVDINDASVVTFNANSMEIRPSIINQEPFGSWVVILGDGVITDSTTGLKSAGVYLESNAYHVNEDGYEFLFYTTFRPCVTCA